MGVISITRRSETLGNIGGTSMAHGVTDTDARGAGTARHFSPHYYATHEWSGDDGIARGIGGFAGFVAGIVQREDERESDELTRKVIEQLDRIDRDERTFTPDDVSNDAEHKYLLGDADADGNYVNAQKRGLRLRTGIGTKQLVEETDKSYADVFTNVANALDASDRAKERARERLFNYQQGRVKYALDVQANEYRKMEVQGARDQLSAFTSAYLSGNEDVLDDVFQAREKLGILEGKTAEQRRLDATTLAQGIATAAFENWEAEMADSADPEAVKAAWEERRKAFVSEDGKTPDDPLLSTAYDNGLNKDGEKNVLAAFDKCAKRSVATARYNRVRLDEQNRDALVAEEQGLYRAKDGTRMIVDPHDTEATKADMADKAIKYGLLADKAEKAGLHGLALSYAKTSQTLQRGAVSYEDDVKKAQMEAEFNRMRSMFNMDGYRDAQTDKFVELNTWQRQEMARDLLNEGRIDYNQYARLVSMERPNVDEQFKALRQHVIDTMDKLIPSAISYNPRGQRFEVSPSKTVRGSTKTNYEWASEDGSESVTYAQIVEAMNLTMLQVRQGKLTPDKANELFDKYATEAIRDQRRMNIQKRLDWDANVLKTYR